MKCPICLNDAEYTLFYNCSCKRFECYSNQNSQIIEFKFSIKIDDSDLILKVHGRDIAKTTTITLYKSTIMELPIPDAKGNKVLMPSVVKVYGSEIPDQFTLKPNDYLQEQIIEIVKKCSKYVKLEKFS